MTPFLFLKYLFSEIRNFLSYIKENHGGIFRKLAFSTMLESYIKLNQELTKKALKLKEIDERINELDKLRYHMSSQKDNVNYGPTVRSAQIIGSDLSQTLVQDETGSDIQLVSSKSTPKDGHKMLSEMSGKVMLTDLVDLFFDTTFIIF
jgi:hypothetical protein